MPQGCDYPTPFHNLADGELSAAELRLVETVIRVCPQYRWMQALGPVQSRDRLSRRDLHRRLRRLPAADRRCAYRWLGGNLPGLLPSRRIARVLQRLRRRLAAELWAFAVRVEGMECR